MALGTGTEKRQTAFLCSQCSSCYTHSSEKESLGLEDAVLIKKVVKSGWEGLTGEKGLLENIAGCVRYANGKEKKGQTGGKTVQKCN